MTAGLHCQICGLTFAPFGGDAEAVTSAFIEHKHIHRREWDELMAAEHRSTTLLPAGARHHPSFGGVA